MPNWCECRLELRGDRDVLRDWVAVNTVGSRLTFAGAVEVGSLADAMMCVDVWGTKWDAAKSEVTFDNSEGEIVAEFDTAWNPPLTWLEAMVAQWPGLSGSLWYGEGNMNFQGRWRISEGEAWEECVDDYWDDAGEELRPLAVVA